MPCNKPLTAWQIKEGSVPVFTQQSARRHANARELILPCRRCLGCRIDKEIEWSIRMMHEADQHDHNEFVTLTYDPEHLPWDNSLDHKHFQKFIRTLRKKTGQKIRYFVAGEYGEQFSRPHYHCILFGLELTDKIQVGAKSFTSDLLRETWGLGHVDIGESVTRASCVYTAGYMLKDTKKEWQDGYVWPNQITGESAPRKPPYAKMSNRPGIGKEWYDRWSSDVFPHDNVVMDGRIYRSPAYYFRLLEKENPDLWAKIKARRLEAVAGETFAEKFAKHDERSRRENFLRETAGNKEQRSSRRRGTALGRGKFKDKQTLTGGQLTAAFRKGK